MDKKVSFVMYDEWGALFEMLSIEEQGLAISAVFKYQNTGEIPDFEGQLKMVFSIMKNQFDRDCKKWHKIRQQRSESGKKGAIARWRDSEELTNSQELNKSNGPNLVREILEMQ